jgi:hypothetical protein
MTMTEAFDPRNELERKLLATHEGQMAQDAFIKALLAEQIFMPVLDDDTGIQGLQRSSKAKPLTIQEEGGTNVLILFTSPERAKPFVQHFPGYEKGGLLTEFSWVVERIDGSVGIAINPGWDVGIDFDPEMVASMAGSAAGQEIPGR